MPIKLNFNTQCEIDDKIILLMQDVATLALQNEDIEPELFACDILIDISFVDESTIKKINNEYRNIDKITDVLSFPQYENPAQIKEDANLGCIILGDVVICDKVAKMQAEQYNHSYEREIIYLFTHSIFHLLGYDHMDEQERKEMRNAEEKVLKKLNISRDFEIKGDA